MVTTHDKPTTWRGHSVALIHALLRRKELVRSNKLMDPEEKEKRFISIDAELFKAQSMLDDSPTDLDEGTQELSRK